MKVTKVIFAVAVVGVFAWLAWNYFAGPLRHQREMHAFADKLEGCEVFSEPVFTYVSKSSLEYRIDGPENGRCAVRMETAGPHEIRCAFALADLPVIANGFRDLADSVDMFGGYTYQFDSSNPDPLTKALNSNACETKAL